MSVTSGKPDLSLFTTPSYTHMGNQYAMILAEALKKSPQIRTLLASEASLSQKGALKILNALT